MSKVGFPIRKSSDQRLFAPSRSLSQRTTSFIASYRQGIHQMPLSHLIALISNAHHAQRSTLFPRQRRSVIRRALYIRSGRLMSIRRQIDCAHCARKTRPVSIVRATNCANFRTDQKSIRLNPNFRCRRKICADSAGYAPQALVPLYDVRYFNRPSLGSERKLCLFNHGYCSEPARAAGSAKRSRKRQTKMVEPDGIEPTTSCLQSTRSPS